MKKDIVNQLEISVNKAVDFIYSVSNKNAMGQPIAFSVRRDLNEILESFYKLSSAKIIQPIDDTILRAAFRAGEEVIHEKLLHFGNYYYSKQKLYHAELEEKEEILKRTNVETASMLSRIRSFQLSIDEIGGSTDDYFVDRMPKLLDGITYVFRSKHEELYIPSVYNLLNLHRTIFFYTESGHTTYLEKLNNLRERVTSLLDKTAQLIEFEKIIDSNESVKLFYEQYLFQKAALMDEEYKFREEETKLDGLTLQRKLRVLSNLSYLNKDLFIVQFENSFPEIKQTTITDTAIIIDLISSYFRLKGEIELIDLNIKSGVERVELAENMNSVFKQINNISSISISKEELDILYNYGDSELREKVGRTLLNIPPYEIEREIRKPHGVSEISDMEVRVRIGGKIVYLCMPFKTGKEIKADSVTVGVMYQLLRPFFHFNNCAVVFVTAKKCSQNLVNEIKRAYDKYGFCIEILEQVQLAKLLKVNGLLN